MQHDVAERVALLVRAPPHVLFSDRAEALTDLRRVIVHEAGANQVQQRRVEGAVHWSDDKLEKPVDVQTVHLPSPVHRWSHADAVRVGAASHVFWPARAGRALLRRRGRRARARALPLACPAEPSAERSSCCTASKDRACAHYMRGISDKAWAAGWNVVRLNQRNCGGTERLSRGLYHSGLTHDAQFVMRELLERDGCAGRRGRRLLAWRQPGAEARGRAWRRAPLRALPRSAPCRRRWTWRCASRRWSAARTLRTSGTSSAT